MANLTLLYFGMLDATALDAYYDADVDFNETQIHIDLNFENKIIEIDRLEKIQHFIENIRIHDITNKKHIENDFTEGDTVKEYIAHHLEELAIDDLIQLIGLNTKTADQPMLLLNKLHLIRVGLYPDSKEQFAVFDYSLGRELTNYLVVVNTDENGNLDYITMES